ncbi:MAG: hypothetical protein HYT62_03890, partial [Candidatus Yanofskybacteria bacterium]|nr:hypothetical protein [Candidatus Yanofskybacteria bacterium]
TVLGAVILLSSYIILYTINPDLVGGTLTLPKITMQPTTIPPPPPGGGTSQIAAQNLIGVIGLNQFTNANPDCGNPYHARQNIQDVAAGNLPAVCSNQCTNSCTAGGSSGTVNLNPGMLNGLAALWNAGFRFRVTSLSTGSHSPSSSHYQGNGVDIQILFADLTLNTSSAIWQQARNFLNAIDAGAFCEEGDGGSNSSCSPIGSGNAAVDHIHWTY